jgi:hypothetical protein
MALAAQRVWARGSGLRIWRLSFHAGRRAAPFQALLLDGQKAGNLSNQCPQFTKIVFLGGQLAEFQPLLITIVKHLHSLTRGKRSIGCFAEGQEPYSMSCTSNSFLGWRYTVSRVWESSSPRVIINDMRRVVTLERRIQELCIQAVTATDADALVPIMDELKSSLQEHNEELKLMVAEYPFLLDDLSKPAA